VIERQKFIAPGTRDANKLYSRSVYSVAVNPSKRVGLKEHLHGLRYFGDKGLFILFILITFFIRSHKMRSVVTAVAWPLFVCLHVCWSRA